jgi:antirestriction protein ArdC
MEELVAEMSAAFLRATLDIENLAGEQQSASCLASWLKVLKADRTAIFTASKLAAAASDYLLSFCPVEQPEELEEVPF